MFIKNDLRRVFISAIFITSLLYSCTPVEKDSKSQRKINSVEENREQSDTHDEKKTFAIVYPLLHPFFAETNRGARDAAEKLGVNLTLIGPLNYSIEEQIMMMEKLIDSEVDGIGLGAFDPEELNPVINKAMDAGINVICFDTDAPNSRRLSFISTDNFSQGMHLGKITVEYLKGQGKVIISQGVPTQLNLNQRLDGIRNYLADYPEIEILSVNSGYGNHEKTLASIETMVNEHPDFDALIGLDAQAGPSAVVVWRSRGLNQFLIVSEDMPETIKGIRDSVVTATITQEQYLWGQLIVERLEQASKGEKLKLRETTSTRLITEENVNEFYPETE